MYGNGPRPPYGGPHLGPMPGVGMLPGARAFQAPVASGGASAAPPQPGEYFPMRRSSHGRGGGAFDPGGGEVAAAGGDYYAAAAAAAAAAAQRGAPGAGRGGGGIGVPLGGYEASYGGKPASRVSSPSGGRVYGDGPPGGAAALGVLSPAAAAAAVAAAAAAVAAEAAPHAGTVGPHGGNASGGGGGGGSGQSPQRWQEAYLDLEQEKRRVESELRGRSAETGGLAREAQALREQIQDEQEKRKEKIAEFSKELKSLEHENKQLQMKLMKVQMQDSAKHSDVTTVKKEVVAKTTELEKMMREFQQTHQERLFARVWGVTSAMMSVCQKPDVSIQIQTPAATEEALTPAAPPSMPSKTGVPMNSTIPAVERISMNSTMPATEAPSTGAGARLDPETQQSLKRRLQSLGDVVVYSSDKFEACCASGRGIPPGALRVRPRRCDHVFLVEHLMPHWAEGLCPVCRCSFAYDRPQDAGYDESDRYSSVSTSVSQAVSLAMPRLPHQGSSMSDGGSLARGPRALRIIEELGTESRGRSSSLSRANRRRQSTSHSSAIDARSDASGGEARMSGGGGGHTPSPLSGAREHRGAGSVSEGARSIASLQSRASSVPLRERGPPHTPQQAMRAL